MAMRNIALSLLLLICDISGSASTFNVGNQSGSEAKNTSPCSSESSMQGPCRTGTPPGITYAITALNWTRTISSSLTGGTTATVTLTPCPTGIDTTGKGLYQIAIYSSAYTAFEAQEVTGGTCTSGASSGTVVFTPNYSYSTGYHMLSASSGIQETWNSTCGTYSYVAQDGQCNVILPANNTSNNLANNYAIYGTLFLRGSQAALSGYGARIFCLERGPCIQAGDQKSANDFSSITVRGITFNACGHTCGSQYPDWTTNASYAGVNITNTVESSGVQTITTATAHGFRVRDMVTILFTDDSSYWGDAVVVSVPSATTFTVKGASGTNISSQATPGVVALAFDAVLDNAYSTHLIDLTIDGNNGAGRFNNFFSFWDDENATVSHFSGTGAVNHSLTWSGSYIFSGGAAHAPNSQQFAPVISVRDSSITANGSNCATVYNSNGLYFENTVCQASGLWQVYSSNTRGNYQGANIKNIYSESACALNPASPAATPFPGLGVAGMIFGDSTTVARYSVLGGNGVAGCTQISGTGSTIGFSYYIVVHDNTLHYTSSPELVEYWNSTGSDSPSVKWPRVANGRDNITYDVIRMTPAGVNTATAPGYNATPYPYPGGCPGGSGGTCGSVATGLTQSSACSGLVCSYTDSSSTSSSAYSVPNVGNYQGHINFWPGLLVYVGEGTVTSPVYVDTELAPGICFGCGGSAIQIADRCNAYTSAGSGAYDVCIAGIANNGVPNQGALFLPDGFPGSRMVMSKGRLNFLDEGSAIDPHHIITLLDSQPGLTPASPGYRPPASANDVWIGTDVAPGSGFTSGQLAFGAPVAITNYIAQIGDGVHANWLEQLTSKQKIFAVPVRINEGNSFTLGDGSPLSKMKIYRVNNTQASRVPPQSCADVAAEAKGLSKADQIASINPPGRLGNLSLNAYPGDEDRIIFHFCNPSSSEAFAPSGTYTFLALR